MHSGGVKYDEYIVYDARQALPRYIVHYASAGGIGLASTAAHSFSVNGVLRFELQPSRSVDFKDPLQMHFRMVESQVLRMMHGSGVKLSKVEYIENKKLMDKFEAKRTEFKKMGISADVVLSFHGTTSRDAVESIVKNNFDIARLGNHTGNKGAYGAGFYFSDFPSTSMGYGGNSNMLMCKLLPGTVTDVGPCLGAPIQGNSHRTGRSHGGYGQELVIPDPDQVLPCYILHFG